MLTLMAPPVQLLLRGVVPLLVLVARVLLLLPAPLLPLLLMALHPV